MGLHRRREVTARRRSPGCPVGPRFGPATLPRPSVASAHAYDIGRPDVPIPISLFIGGAARILIVSFIALSILWPTTPFEREHWRPLPRTVPWVLQNPVTEVLAGACGVALLGVVVWSGFYGTNVAIVNFSVTFVFITVWLGGVLVSVLLGNIYRAFNPWRAIGRAVVVALRRDARPTNVAAVLVSEAPRALAGGGGTRRVCVDRADLRRKRNRGDPACNCGRGAYLHGLQLLRDGAIRDRAVDL